jgi:hypothetical protein
MAATTLTAGTLGAGHSLPPVEDWHPLNYGDSRMRIAPGGVWFHRGSPFFAFGA